MLDGFNRGYCTWFKDKVFGVVIGDLCYDHDFKYRVGDYKDKLESDHDLAKGVWERAERSSNPTAMKATALLIYAAVSTAGNFFWLKGKLKRS